MNNEKPKEKRDILSTILTGTFLILLISAFLAIVFVSAPNDAYNHEFKKEFCQQLGFEEYINESCMKSDNETATMTQIYCIRETKPNDNILDLGKINKCREVIN